MKEYKVFFNRDNYFYVAAPNGTLWVDVAAQAVIEYTNEARQTVEKALRFCDDWLQIYFEKDLELMASVPLEDVKAVLVGIGCLMPCPNNSELIAAKCPKPHDAITAKCDQLKAMLLQKNADYGNSALEPVRIFSTASTEEQIRVRIDDKLSRLSAGGDKHFSEDTVMDLVGYLILLMIKMEEN